MNQFSDETNFLLVLTSDLITTLHEQGSPK